MELGPVVYILWLVVLLASLIIAGVHISRKKLHGLTRAATLVFGALMTWALVSAYIGAQEIDNYSRSKPFAWSLAIGAAGVVLLVASVLRIKKSVR